MRRGTRRSPSSTTVTTFGRGGAATIQRYLRACLIDHMHLAIVPVRLGGGERLFDHVDGGPDGYECVEFVSSPTVTHARSSPTTR
jgi:dihydrofolate reductase